MSLINNITARKNNISFHTPGHSNSLANIPDLTFCDTTELIYSDNLLNSNGVISDLEKNLASVYNAEACFISTNGTTNAILQAFYTLKNKGAFLFIGQCHTSFYNACRLFDITAFHIDKWSYDLVLPENIKVIAVTYPDYFGNCIDIKKLYAYCKINKLILFIDSAHGSHFAFSNILPLSAPEYSDMAVLSLHKTLPVATGGSLLCVKNEYSENVFCARKMLHSTSPSFPIILTIEHLFNDYIPNAEKNYDDIHEFIIKFKTKLDKKYYIEKNSDFTRLVIKTPFDGYDVLKILSEKYNIDMEASYGNSVIAIVTPYNYKKLNFLCDALNDISLKENKELSLPFTSHKEITPLVFGGEAEKINIALSIGRKAFTEMGFYPPGVPFIYSHDIITKDFTDTLNKYSNNAFGLVNNSIFVVK